MQTKNCMKSSIPYVVLGVLYSYLLYLSWTPDTIRFMFASKYWLPEVWIYAYMYFLLLKIAMPTFWPIYLAMGLIWAVFYLKWVK